MLNLKKYILLLSLLFLSSLSWGQVRRINDLSNLSNISNISAGNLGRGSSFPNNSSFQSPDTSSADTSSVEGSVLGIVFHEDTPDSVLQHSVFMFHRQTRQVIIMAIEHPSLELTGSQFHDCLDAFNGDYFLTVSELGHPHYSIFPSFSTTPGLAYKPSLFPGYYKTPENITFYQAQTPYEVLSYNSSLNQSYQVHFTHTQNINDHWNYALDYHLINPDGAFSNSSATDHLFDFNTNYYSRDARYQLSAGAIWQRMLVGENGGLSNPSSYYNKTFRNTSGIQVVSTNTMSFNSAVTLFAKQSFNTVRQFEWYRPIKQPYVDTLVDSTIVQVAYYDSVTLDSLYRDSTVYTTRYEAKDSIVGYDTLQPHAPHIYNTGVFGLELQYDRQKYRYGSVDSSLYNQFSATLFWTNDAYMDHRWRNALKLYGGIRPQLSWLQLNPVYYTDTLLRRVAIYPFARVEISPWPAAELNVFGETAPDLSEYNLDATLLFPFRDTVGHSRQHLSFHAIVKAYRPELIYYAQCLSAANPISAELQSIGIRKIEADYHREGLLDIHLSASHISHNTWFREVSTGDGAVAYQPQQATGSALLLQGRANLYLKLARWLHFDMQQHLQYSSDQEQIRVPLFASKNSLYADFKVFRGALRVQTGFDLRYHTRFYADAYDPMLGIFYRQDNEQVGNYLWADFFLNLQIKRATIYVKAGHFNTFLEQNAYCVIPNYPMQQFGLFYGLTWKFFD